VIDLMESGIDSYQFDLLKRMYEQCTDKLPAKADLPNQEGSLFFYFITRASDNDRYSMLCAASMKHITPEDAAILLDSGYIRKTDRIGFYTLTAKGLWLVETAVNNIKYGDLIDFFDQKFFDTFDNKAISDLRKIILLSMVAIRSFSKGSAVNMRTDADVKDKWLDVLRDINAIMVDNGIIQKKNSLQGKYFDGKTEHPASKIMRHTDKLSKETKSIYNNLSGDNRYYLDLSENGNINTERLGELISMIFENKLNDKNYRDFVDFVVPYAKTNRGLDFISSITENFYALEYNKCIEDAFKIAKRNANGPT